MDLLRLLVLPMLLLFATAQGQADEPTPRPENVSAELWETLQDIDRQVATIQTLRARFIRHRHTPLLREPLVSEGVVHVKDQFVRWDTHAPSPSTTLIRDEEVRIYQPEDRRLEVYATEQRAEPFGAGPLPRIAEMLADFSIEEVQPAALFEDLAEDVAADDAGGEPGAALALRLTPKREALAEQVQALEMLIERETGRLRRLRMRTGESQWTEYRFVEVEVNVEVPDATFTLDLPPNVEVVRPLEGEQ